MHLGPLVRGMETEMHCDPTAEPDGHALRVAGGGGLQLYRGIRWTSNGDSASLRTALRLRVASEFADFLEGAWPADNPDAVEHYVLLLEVYRRSGDSEPWAVIHSGGSAS